VVLQTASGKTTLSLVGAAAAWGIATAVSKRAVEEISPLTLFPIQLAISLLALGTFVALARERPQRPDRLSAVAWLGVLNPGFAYCIGLIGLSRISASMSVLMWATEPLLIVGLAVMFLKERIAPRTALALAIAVSGVILIAYQADTRGTMSGILLTLIGVLACAFYTIVAKKLLVDTSALVGLIVQQGAALGFAVVVLAVSNVWFDTFSLTGISRTGWISAFLSGLLYYAVGFWLYLIGLRQTSASRAGAFLNLIPFFGVSAGFILLGEGFSAQEWIGAGLIIGSLAVGLRQQDRVRRLELIA
jgi:drug/metabolite transporter (DMT)-like permease